MHKIFIGNYNKIDIIKSTNAKKIYVVGDCIPNIDAETITFKESIMYKYYFRWLSELNKDCVLVLNNILRKVQRTCLEYNCIRYYAKQAGSVIVFSDFPLIQSKDDFMILYDMIQPDPFWKRHYEEVNIFENVSMNCIVNVNKTDVILSEKIVQGYEEAKEAAINAVKKDADIIPRRLLKYAEKAKKGNFDKLTDLKSEMNVCVSQLKVDLYFYNELLRKVDEINGIYKKLQQ